LSFAKQRVAPRVCACNLNLNTVIKQEASIKTIINHREFKVKQTGTKYFYWSERALRWLPVAKSKVIFAD
jgi:hypothetical protein